jgi:hypothetical protein
VARFLGAAPGVRGKIEQHFEIIDKREPFGRELALVMKAKP